MSRELLHVTTQKREQMLPVTAALARLVQDKGWRNGAVVVFSPHTTAGLTVNEAADPDVREDMTHFINTMVPQDRGFRHSEGNSDAHIKTTLVGPHVMLLVDNAELCLGTWQGVYLCEWDGPRRRTLWVQFLPGE